MVWDFCRWKGKVISQKLNILDAVMFDVRRLPIMEKEEWWCLTNGGRSDCFHMIKHSQEKECCKQRAFETLKSRICETF